MHFIRTVRQRNQIFRECFETKMTNRKACPIILDRNLGIRIQVKAAFLLSILLFAPLMRQSRFAESIQIVKEDRIV